MPKEEPSDNYSGKLQAQVMQQADHDTLVRLETKMDNFLTTASDHEIRLRGLEKSDESNKGKTSQSNRNITVILTVANVLMGALAIYFGIHH